MRRSYRLLSAICLPAMVAVLAPGCGDDEQICAAPLASCNGQCVETRFDPNNCGACGVQCGDGLVCSVGECQEACDSGLTDCDGRCVDTALDPLNCGACGNACDAGLLCSAGACAVTCVGGTLECNGACVDVDTDEANCGACGNACGAGETCIASACVPGCDSGQTLCNNACVDTDSDVANCGSCGTACGATQVCAVGSCEDVEPLGAFVTRGYGSAVEQDLYVVNDYTFELIKVNATTFDDRTVTDYEVASDGSIVLVAAQDDKGVVELYHAATPGAALTKLNPTLVSGGNVQNNPVLSADGTRVLYIADQETDEVFDLWMVDVANPGVATKVNPALDADEDVASAAISADGTTAVYVADEETEGLDEAFVVDLSNPGSSTKVNDTVLNGVDSVRINNDGTRVVYLARQETFTWDELYDVAVSNPGVSTKLNPVGDGGEAQPVGDVSAFRLTHDGTRAVMRVRRGNQNDELYVATLGGTPNPTALSAGGGTLGSVEVEFVIASDDSTVYFCEDLADEDRVYAVDLASPGTPVAVSAPSLSGNQASAFVLSADDSALVYRQEVDGAEGSALYQVDTANPGTATQVTPFIPNAYPRSFAVSSGGERILYTDSVDPAASPTLRVQAYVASVDAPGVRVEVGPALAHETFRGDVYVDGSGEHTYYVSDEETDDQFELYRVHAGAALTSEKVSAALGPAGDVESFVVSGDGTTIVYLADADADGFPELYLVSAANLTVATKVTPASSAGHILDFKVSDDGSTVLYRSSEGGTNALYAVEAASLGTAVQVSASAGGNVLTDYASTPDGATVLYRDGTTLDLFSVAVSNPGTTTKVNHDAVSVFEFQPSHDWTMVAYRGTDNQLYRVTLSAPGTETLVNAPLLPTAAVNGFRWSHDDTFFIYRADDIIDGVEELTHVTLAAPAVFTKVNAPIVTGEGITNFALSPNDGYVAFRSNHEGGRNLYIVDLSNMGTHTRAHALPTFTFMEVEGEDPQFTSDSVNVIYRNDLAVNGRTILSFTPLATPGVATPIEGNFENLGADVPAGGWGVTSADDVVYARNPWWLSSTDVYAVDLASPSDRVSLTPFLAPTQCTSVTAMK